MRQKQINLAKKDWKKAYIPKRILNKKFIL